MIVICVKCGMGFDDESSKTVCPHGIFAADPKFQNYSGVPSKSGKTIRFVREEKLTVAAEFGRGETADTPATSTYHRETKPSELEKALDRDTQTWESIAVQFKRYNDLYEKRLHLEFPGAFE